jgi:hypothetical protein
MHLKITFISDTHGKHNLLNKDLPGGDILIHAGDFMNGGYEFQEATNFLEWFNKINIYTDKIFIAGNHDRIFENIPPWVKNNLPKYPTIDYIQDEEWVDYNDGPNGDSQKIIFAFMVHLGNLNSAIGHSIYPEMERK